MRDVIWRPKAKLVYRGEIPLEPQRDNGLSRLDGRVNRLLGSDLVSRLRSRDLQLLNEGFRPATATAAASSVSAEP